MTSMDMEMWQDFVVEARENLEEFEPNLLLLEQQPDEVAILNDCFRNMHSIKGAANYMGLERIATLSHRMESLFDAVRSGRVSLEPDAFDLIFACVDRLKTLIDQVEANQREEDEVADLVARLEDLASGEDNSSPSPVMDETGEEAHPAEDHDVSGQDLLPENGLDTASGQDTEEEWDEDQELMAIFREEMKSLYSQLREILREEADKQAISSILDDMERVTHYVGLTGLSSLFKELSGRLSSGDEILLKDGGGELLSRIAEGLSSHLDMVLDHGLQTEMDSGPSMEEDQELYEIFLDFFKQEGRPLFEIPERPDRGWLEKSAEAAETLRASAHYMDYAEVVAILDKWRQRAEELCQGEEGPGPEDVSFFKELWERLVAVLPDVAGLFGDQQTHSNGVEEDLSVEPEAGGGLEDAIEKEVEDLFDDFAVAAGVEPDAAVSLDEESDMSEEDGGLEGPVALEAGLDELEEVIDNVLEPEQEGIEITQSDRPTGTEMATAALMEGGQGPVVSPPLDSGTGSPGFPGADIPQRQPSAVQTAEMIKVDLAKVEALLGDVGELVVLRSSLVQAADQLKSIYAQWLDQRLLGTAELRPLKEVLLRLTENASALERVVHQLQDGVMRIRMLPVSTLFNRYPRMVRDLSRKLGKHVELVLYGADTALDKQVIEQLADPMQHIVRNALDHGIESPEERRRAGKPPQGRLVISASQEGNNVVITVSDDGKGLDREAILRKAIEKGVIDSAQAQTMSQGQVWNLIFLPGMTTAEKVSEVSGRGVGLDVVRSNIERIGGSISISSEPGKGTIFVLRIPLTLAIIKGLVVRVGSQAMIVPIAAVRETFRVDSAEISRIEGYEIISVRQQTLPLIRLGKVFRGTGATGQEERIFAVRISLGDSEVCLGVDELLGQQEVVIKPLSEYLTDQPGFSGATILGDGSIALILDLPAMMDKARNFVKKRQELLEQEALGLSYVTIH